MNKFEQVILDNGLVVYFYVDKRRHSTFFQHITKFGGLTKDFICDGKEYHLQDGIAHILEHYIVEENKYGNFLKLLGEKQMVTNASTHYDMTRFYFDTVENVDYGITTLLNGIYAPLFSEERLEKMKGPIYQEIRGKSDNKFYSATLKTYEALFHKYKFRSIGGTLDDVKNTTLDELRLCYETFYQPSNQFIVVGGNFDKDHVLELIKDFYNKLELKKHDFEILKLEEEKYAVSDYSELEFPTGQEFLEVTYKINLDKYSIEEQLKLDFYFTYFFKMFFSLASPLYNKLVKNKIITNGIGCNLTKLNNYLLISIGSYSDDIKQLEKEIKSTMKKLEDFDEEKFDLDKKQTIIDIVLREDNIGSMVMPFVNNIVIYDYHYPDTKEQIMGYTYEDFIKTMKDVDFSNSTVTVIKNKE